MTLIECFNNSMIENIAGCLSLRPEKLILLGTGTQMNDSAQRYQSILDQRGIQPLIQLCDIGKLSITEIAEQLATLVRAEQDCVIDLTGGDEMVVMAVGAMLAGLNWIQRKHISVQKYDVTNGTALDCDGDGAVSPGVPASLSVDELITLHGGVIHSGTYQPPKESTREDLDPLWEIVSADPKEWNKAISVLGEFESRSDSRTQICLPLGALRGGIANFDEKEEQVQRLLDEFWKRGLIDDHRSRNFLTYTYSTPLIRHCTHKAGNVLEVKTLLEARALRENGQPYFQDCQMGVNIDWDGIVYDPTEHIPETRNEIDLILMRGMTPLFISCKNGNIGDEELYKLHTAATRFGGPNAKKMLIATDLDRKSPAANRSFIQRAWDMDIFLVTDAAELSREEWEQIFRQTLQ